MDDATFAATLGYAPAAGDRLFILVNDGSDAIGGRFTGLANGSIVSFPQYEATISYFGNSATLALTGGNDVVLYNFTPVPEPAGLLGAAALVGLAATRYRRRPVAV